MPAGLSELRFDEQYIESCFYAWYRAGCPSLKTRQGTVPVGGSRIAKIMPPTEDGRRPEINTISKWMERYGWKERAEALDAQVSLKLDEEVVQERIATLKKLADAGQKLLDKGLKFIEDEKSPFTENPGAAVRAVIAGSEMLFKYGGAADKLSAIAQMSDKQLEAEARRLLGKESNNENENIVDAESEDIPSEDDNQSEEDNE